MSKYLVLGSAGQIGSHLVKHLRDGGDEVIEFDLVDGGEFDLRQADNPKLAEAMKACDFVYFLAFDVGGSRYLAKYQQTYDFLSNNVKILNNTFDVLRDAGKPFVFASSQMSNMSYSSYGVLKAIGEHYTKVLNGLVVKFWNVYGYEADLAKAHVITDFILKALKTGKIDMLTDGREQRQFLHADDCSRGLRMLADQYDDLSREASLHFTTFEWVDIYSVAQTIGALLGDIKIEKGAAQDSVQHDKRNEPDPYVLTFWKPEVSLEDGISELIDRYRTDLDRDPGG